MSVVLERALAETQRIVLERLRNIPARVYLFGSHATGEANRFSDIDVAIEPLAELPPDALLDITEALEDSTIPYFVDVVDLSCTSPEFRERVRREGVLWRG